MLAQDYADFEVIAVDDRSTDNTFDTLQQLARSDSRLTAVRGEPLPEGWIGKPWALEQAKRASRGEWILATDADMVFDPTLLSQAMSLAAREGYDAITLAPAVSSDSFWSRLVMPVAGWLIMLLYPVWRVNNPRSGVALGVGGFFLMRRAAHDSVGGYEKIRGDVTDDLSTARLLKQGGFRLHLAAAPTLLRTPMYSSLAELFEGFGKNSFAGSGSNALRAVVSSVIGLAFTALPAVTTLAAATLWLVEGSPRSLPLVVSALGAYVALTAAFIPVYRETRTPARYAALAFLAHMLMVAILLNSTWRMITGRGVVWKSRNIYGPDVPDSTIKT